MSSKAVEAAPTAKEKAIYQAVVDLFMEGADLSGLTVSEITAKAGIGKGTAYDYFSDKEDMIARAICYNIDQYCLWIYQGISEKDSLYEKIDLLLTRMEKEVAKANCLMRLVNSMSMDSAIGKRIRQQQEANGNKTGPIRLLEAILKEEFFTPALSEEMLYFLARNAIARIFSYGIVLGNSERKEELQRMHRLVCMGICHDVEDVRTVSS